MSAQFISETVWEGSTPTLLARLYIWDATVAQQADITSIAWKSVDERDTATTVDSGTFTVADVVYDALQTDARWNDEATGQAQDSTGYNFAATLPATAIPDGEKTYLIQLTITPVVGAAFYGGYKLSTKPVY